MLVRNLRRGFAIALLAVAVCVGSVFFVPEWRQTSLRALGRALVAEDPRPRAADIVIVSTDSLAAGILEAAELVDAGVATRVGLFARTASPLGLELARRGLPRLDLHAYSLDLLHALGITHIEMIPAVVGTVDEGQVLQQWCTANNIHSIVFVSMADHSRRTRRVLGRALGQHGIQVAVRWARFSQFDPDHWWQDRNGQRVEIVESQKLLMDILRHPL
jgi:uncharacterized SAM-binding protein YcdF (DUF218 family)